MQPPPSQIDPAVPTIIPDDQIHDFGFFLDQVLSSHARRRRAGAPRHRPPALARSGRRGGGLEGLADCLLRHLPGGGFGEDHHRPLDSVGDASVLQHQHPRRRLQLSRRRRRRRNVASKLLPGRPEQHLEHRDEQALREHERLPDRKMGELQYLGRAHRRRSPGDDRRHRSLHQNLPLFHPAHSVRAHLRSGPLGADRDRDPHVSRAPLHSLARFPRP